MCKILLTTFLSSTIISLDALANQKHHQSYFPIKQDKPPVLSKSSISLIDPYPGDVWLILSGLVCRANSLEGGFCLVLQYRHKLKLRTPQNKLPIIINTISAILNYYFVISRCLILLINISKIFIPIFLNSFKKNWSSNFHNF